MTHATHVERTSDRELVITRTFNALPDVIYEAWTQPERLKLWWAPKSFGVSMVGCEADVRAGGKYRFTFVMNNAPEAPMSFFGHYVEVTPNGRLVWTNEEGGDSGATASGGAPNISGSVTTVTFEETDGKTRLVMHDLHPSKEALDGAIESGSTCGFEETFNQLDELLRA